MLSENLQIFLAVGLQNQAPPGIQASQIAAMCL
ncbi:hypothetical protein GGQ85_000874 [Nitrobacter vulgaris]|nr:hypothetical protein [Nitrobacter vulgaris]